MKLIVNEILTEIDFEEYLKVVESFKIINPFYKILGSSIGEIIDDQLYYFTFTNAEGKILILMPFFLRRIPYKHEEKIYYDVISPYGYSGPLFNEDLSRGYLIMFWQEVDTWYKNNNVVSEFIRFSLNHNHHFYSGILIPTLTNVNGEIVDEEKQWNAFKQKVRNNYRKSLNHLLDIKIKSKDITDSDIVTYYDVYINTMQRIGAEDEYLYSIEYFRNIIKLSKNNFALAFVYKDNVVISVELILIAGETLYSFLGGTLSEAFSLRPNDFLKIEVMKWARNNGYKYYLLGGGRKENDTLYQYKKSFFPNDMDIIYYTGRKILNKKVYNELDEILNIDVVIEENNAAITLGKSNYFPAYRKNAFKKQY
ncbi:GNAT family N-acetyltransferase [Mariniflexile soesokkakense]|uniref:GNAT family N-acetyltransferase n=1 Tax=Mariniflexile soesokkakense TaxID=1343160 RepID=A0ABV0AF63_9FLAO